MSDKAGTIQRLASMAYISFVFVSSFFLFQIAALIWLLTILFDKRLLVLHYYTMLWSALYIWIIPTWKVEVKGREKIDSGQTYLMVSNHQSALDVLLVPYLFVPFKWVSKAEIYKVPFIGWNMYLNRYIKLERGLRKSIVNMMTKCEHSLRSGSSVYIFPEGTRSKDGRMKKFAPGAFILAKRTKVPILPLVISGTCDAMPKNSLNIDKTCKMNLTVLDPIDPSQFENMSTENLTELVQKRIENFLMG
ncbi:MAG: 1-acyl-sn-glycerol-3-phosphate acyltransferase [Flavobacteriales bacterium]|nr:1-acyl-sn-glycerol-3-phosphate acyltransferase [Flavobacteriales bacterium]